MIKSMTAFGRAEQRVNGYTYTVEMRGVNKRYCEIVVRMPAELLSLEDMVKKMIGAQISRGRVEVTVKQQADLSVTPHVRVNFPLAKSYYTALCQLDEALGTDEGVRLDTVLGMDKIVVPSEPEPDLQKAQEVLSSCIREGLEQIETMRVREGKRIYEDFQHRLALVEKEMWALKELAPSVFVDYRDKLADRIDRLTEGRVELDANRLAQEAAFMADKSDITEEIVRTESHLAQFRTMIDTGGSVGRTLDFLLQELNREVNTIGSKAGDANLSQKVVGIKSELEKIREQVQNIE